MVERIVDIIPSLSPNRILAAITFTNAATDSIRQRLEKLIQIPPNVFVGTNYRFFNQFIFLPFASLFDLVPLDKVFLEIDVRQIVHRITKKNPSPQARKIVQKRVINELLNEGKIPFEQIAYISARLMEDQKIRRVVCNRIQYLFKDEFQDTDTIQLRIFDAIRKGRKTTMYSVGDPEQYILGFTYDQRGIKKPSFDNIPINRFLRDCNECKIDLNRRATEQLVSFTNHFHTCIKQVSYVGRDERSGVFFIPHIDLDIVISKYLDLTKTLFAPHANLKLFFLGYENRTFDHVKGKYGLIPISNENRHPKSTLGASLDIISATIQKSEKTICEECGLDKMAIRKVGIKILKAIASGQLTTIDGLSSFISEEINLSCSNEPLNLASRLNMLISSIRQDRSLNQNYYYSSIHKAKGLEADCVLSVAKNKGELDKWLETDHNKRRMDKTDTCRIGYVAFTRAKLLLCIACKEKIDSPLERKLRSLGVTILN